MTLSHTRFNRTAVYLSAAVAVFVVSLAVLYWPVFIKLVDDWAHDDNYSHGFLIPPLAAYLVWERWDRLKAEPASSSLFGLVVIGLDIWAILNVWRNTRSDGVKIGWLIGTGFGALITESLATDLGYETVYISTSVVGDLLLRLGWQELETVLHYGEPQTLYRRVLR